MLDKKPETGPEEAQEVAGQEPVWSLTDEEIVTQRTFPRRHLLTAGGAILAAGSLAVVSGARASSQEQDPDKAKPADPDKAKPADPDRARPADPDKAKPADPDKARPADPDKARPADPDKAKPADPDKAKPADPDKAQPSDPDKAK